MSESRDMPTSKERRKDREQSAAILLTALLAGLAAASLFAVARSRAGTWTVDDAVISYSYARNIAHGHGAVAFPGGPRVEGFSNPLQVLGVSALIRLGLFHPLTTHRTLELLTFGAAAGLALLWLLALAGSRGWALIGVAVFVLFQLLTPATRIWYASGLETVQLTLAVCFLLWRVEVWDRRGPSPAFDPPALFAVGLIRPESLLYPAAALAAFGARALAGRQRPRTLRRTLFVAVGLAVLLAGGFLLRQAYFGDPLPNTYYAKQSGEALRVETSSPIENLRGYVLGEVLPYERSHLLLGLGLLASLAGGLSASALAIPALVAASLALPVVGGADWLGEHRFGIPFFSLCHLAFALGLARLGSWRARRAGSARAVLAAAAVVAVGLSALALASGRARYEEWLRSRHTTFNNIVDLLGFERLELQSRLGLIYPTVLLPDAGGSHWAGGLQSVDVLRLTDFHLARLPRRGWETAVYVYAERQPELLEGHHPLPWPPGNDRRYVEVLTLDNFHFPSGRPRVRYFARRNLIELEEFPAGSRRLESPAGLDLALSPRTLPLVVPGGLLRAELLLRVAEGGAPAPRLELCLERECEQIYPLQLHAAVESPYQPSAGRAFRQPVLLRAPESAGRVDLRLRVPGGGSSAAWQRVIGVEVSEVFSPEALRELVGDPAHDDPVEVAWRLGQLRSQARPRLPSRRVREALARFRSQSRTYHWPAPEAFDVLVAHYLAPPLPGPAAALDDLERPLRGRVADRAAAAVLAVRSGDGEALARIWPIAEAVFNLRRMGVLGVPDQTPAIGELYELGGERLAGNLAPRARYALTLALATLRPEDPRMQRELVAARRGVQGHLGLLAALDGLLYDPYPRAAVEAPEGREVAGGASAEVR